MIIPLGRCVGSHFQNTAIPLESISLPHGIIYVTLLSGVLYYPEVV
jgi:hypothetical protein